MDTTEINSSAVDIERFMREMVRDESCRKFPYLCSAGKTSIGIGRNLTDNGLSDSEIQILFVNDVDSVVSDLDRAMPWWRNMSEPRRRVLMNMCFNLGLTRLLGFKKALVHMQAKRYSQAADEMLDSAWARQVGERAGRLAAVMIRGE